MKYMKIYCSMDDCKYNTGSGTNEDDFNCILSEIALFMNPNTKRPECQEYNPKEVEG